MRIIIKVELKLKVVFKPFLDIILMSAINVAGVRVGLLFAVTWNFSLVKLHYLLEQFVMKFCGDNWILVVKRMLQNKLANEVSSSGYWTLSPCHEEIKNVINLLNVLLIILLVLHELRDERVDTWKVQLWLSSKDLCNCEFVIGSWYFFFFTR